MWKFNPAVDLDPLKGDERGLGRDLGKDLDFIRTMKWTWLIGLRAGHGTRI